MIEQAGLKGRGLAHVVSDRHANFIVAEPECTANDVLRLIDLVRGQVSDRLGVDLELSGNLVAARAAESVVASRSSGISRRPPARQPAGVRADIEQCGARARVVLGLAFRPECSCGG